MSSYFLESFHIMDRHFTQHLSVDLDALNCQSVNQIAVLHAAFFASGGDSNYPQFSEISLSGSSVPKGILPGLHYLLMRASEYVLLTTPVAGRFLNGLLVALVAHQTAFYSCHLSSVFLC